MTNFSKAVKLAALSKDIKLKDLARCLEITPEGLSRMIHGNPSKSSIDKIADQLEMKSSELIALGE